MPANLVTITVSSAGTSRAAALDWMTGGPTSVLISAASTTASATGIVQFTLDDILRTTSTGVLWVSFSSDFRATGSTVTGFTIQASAIYDAPFFSRIESPIAALRVSCTSFSTSGFLMEILQGRGW